jgi:hypothetical protein
MPPKEVLGFLSIAIAFAGYAFYFRDLLRYRVRPHVFSWVVWGLTCGIASAAQISDAAGPGAWAMVFSSACAFVIAAFALDRGERNITPGDWMSFLSALGAILLWIFTKNPLGAVIVITLIDLCAYYPTFRKSWHKPREETMTTWTMNVLKYIPALMALEHVSFITAFYPVFCMVTNGALVATLIYRRAAVEKQKHRAIVGKR